MGVRALTDEENLLIRRLTEKSARGGRYQYLGFLDEHGLGLCASMARGGLLRDVHDFGGYPDAQRRMVRFGSPESLGYDEPWPIAHLLLTPRSRVFGEELNHRDVLGALMSLGIERDVLGDLVREEENWHLFCREEMAPALCGLTQVRRTAVRVCEAPADAAVPGPRTEPVRINVPSARLDAAVAHLLNLSRTRAQELFREERVFVNGMPCTDGSAALKERDLISVRGWGKARYLGQSGMSKKGRIYLEFERFL